MKFFNKLFLFLTVITVSLTSNLVIAQSDDGGRLDI